MRARRLLYALLPLLVLLVAGELAARAALARLPVRPPGMMVPHPTRIWGLEPGEHFLAGASVTITADGLRAVPPNPSPVRIVTLGDSSMFGHGLTHEETLHAWLGHFLASQGVQAQVHCGGIPGYSTEQSLQLMEDVGWSLQPDALIIGSLWSDFQTEYFTDRVWMAALHSPTQRLERLLSGTALWRWARLQVAGPQAAQQGGLPVGWVREPLPATQSRLSLEEYAENLQRLGREARERGALPVYLTPCHVADLRGLPVPWKAYVQAQRQAAEAVGGLWVQTCPLYAASGEPERALYLDELHPSGVGNRLVGEALAAALVGAGWPQSWAQAP